ncbi:glycosyltransferase [Roseococcus sp. SYP-B2431]|uniref:glycosyltransferase family 4 protein n=1 Tax=Roseococcus sp. SYP-B2431 TaxID=2496640 RepID=UPI00103C9860|nr:glycosyltransferase family 4 protein [Roseococcus sp. SYP-B2431]TCI00499.1 glycosyltransferase [Roseococcus sp. SYP-B2431]
MIAPERILAVIPSPFLGGAELQTLQVARGLAGMGAEVAVAAGPAVLEAAGARLGSCHGIPLPLTPEPTFGFTAAHQCQAAALAPFLAAWRPDAALVCCPLPTEAFGALGALRDAAVPCLAVAHLVRTDWRLAESERAWLTGLSPGWAAVSEPSARRLELLFGLPFGRAAAIPNGLPPRAPVPANRARFGLPGGVPLLVQVGRIEERKGAHLAGPIAARIAPARMVLAGEGPLADSLAGAPGVDLLGWVEDVPALLACADAVLLASEHEGVPLVLQEAAWAGRPILATRAALEAWPEAEQVARLVRRDPHDIARAFRATLSDPAGTAARVARARAAVADWDEAAMIRRTAWLLAVAAAR